MGAFGFSRPQDVAVNPRDGSEFVLSSTGVDTYDVDETGKCADTFGTTYKMKVRFDNDGVPKASTAKIIYDGDDPDRELRSPDNLDWAEDGFIYINEDEAEEDSLTGEPLFNDGAVNTREASILQLNPNNGDLTAIAEIDRSVLAPSITGTPVDQDAGAPGEWESSGILDVSELFGQKGGWLFLFDVQAHGIEDQDDFNADSRIVDGDLVEGGQLLFLRAPEPGDVNVGQGLARGRNKDEKDAGPPGLQRGDHEYADDCLHGIDAFAFDLG